MIMVIIVMDPVIIVMDPVIIVIPLDPVIIDQLSSLDPPISSVIDNISIQYTF